MAGSQNGMKLDIVIRGGTLLTMSENMDVIDNPVIGIKDGRIAFAEPGNLEGKNLYTAKEVISASGCLVLPGLINTHTHLPMVCFRGLADDLPLMEWLNNHIFPAEAKFVSREMVYSGAMLAIAEMILSGTTTFCDAYFYESEVARAAVASGMRGVVSQGFIDYPAPTDPVRIADIAERFINKWRSLSPLISPALACHSPYACSPETLSSVKEAARRRDVLFSIHVSETRDEVAILKERFGKTPVQHLNDLHILDDRTLAVHCNWLEDFEIEMLHSRDVKVSHNPESNMKLAAGCARIPVFIGKGIAVGLGTDGCASNNDLDMIREMGTTAKLHKVVQMDSTVMDAKTVLSLATSNGANALGLKNLIGSVEAGKLADIIIVDTNKPHLAPMHGHYSQLVYAASGADVRTSIINGKVVMQDRKLLLIDLPSVMREVRDIAKSIAGN
ncbi:MAG TPA: amidohydrolase [Syntrophales bacterium]|nr:amidohydrolase [Syntrophales bacterium]